MSNLYFIRHANASAGEVNYDKLSSTGIRQAECLGRFLIDEKIFANYIFTGTLLRHKETIQPYLDLLKQKHHHFELLESESLNEFSSELWNSYAKLLSNKDPEILKLINLLKKSREKKSLKSKVIFYKITESIINAWSSNNYKMEGIESYFDFRNRILNFLNILQVNIKSQKNAVIVTSGTPLSILFSHMLNQNKSDELDWIKIIGNTSFSTIQLENNKFFPININSTFHLPLELRTFL